MSTNFDSTKIALKAILEDIVIGKIQLPDFQRGWVWDDEHIRSLLVSIGRSFPIGSIMLLETGGNTRFQIRPIEGVALPSNNIKVEHLILDGQQRLTSLTQVLRLANPVKTKNTQKQEVTRFYYINIENALQGNGSIEDAIIGVDNSKLLKANFGRDVVLDLSTTEKEFQAFYFPCNQILNSDRWEEALMAYDQQKFLRYMKFRTAVLNKYREYEIPIIELKKENSKEAVCLVFEKVNTGGVPLSVFELMTATYAADGFNLRDDWYGVPANGISGRKKLLYEKPLLGSMEPTDFLQGISLLYTYDRHTTDLQNGLSGKEVTAVSAKREQVLMLPLSAYQQWATKLCDGFLNVDRFLRMQGFKKLDYLPYRSQLVPLACVMVHLGERWLEPVIYDKLTRWYWCGVLGELYGGATETRIGLDLQDLMTWIYQAQAPEPTTVIAAGFQASRLDTLRTRTSAAYRGLYILLQRQKSKDFFWKAEIMGLDHDDCAIDIHHVFPVAWCKTRGIPDRVFNSIINKTAISYKANRMIGGDAPSKYLEQLRTDQRVQLAIEDQDEILRTHLIDPISLRSDEFDSFYQKRKQLLIQMVQQAMGKTIIPVTNEILDETDGNAFDEV
jgi:hypothetical protein